jgi:hypothetical protein
MNKLVGVVTDIYYVTGVSIVELEARFLLRALLFEHRAWPAFGLGHESFGLLVF